MECLFGIGLGVMSVAVFHIAENDEMDQWSIEYAEKQQAEQLKFRKKFILDQMAAHRKPLFLIRMRETGLYQVPGDEEAYLLIQSLWIRPPIISNSLILKQNKASSNEDAKPVNDTDLVIKKQLVNEGLFVIDEFSSTNESKHSEGVSMIGESSSTNRSKHNEGASVANESSSTSESKHSEGVSMMDESSSTRESKQHEDSAEAEEAIEQDKTDESISAKLLETSDMSTPETSLSETSTPETSQSRCEIVSSTSLCEICADNAHDAVFVPCGHSGICLDCAVTSYVYSLRCPFCRQHPDQIIKIGPEAISNPNGRTDSVLVPVIGPFPSKQEDIYEAYADIDPQVICPCIV